MGCLSHGIGEAVCGVARSPTAAVFQRLREIPVVQRERGRDVAVAKPGHEAAVEVEPGLVDRPRPFGLDAGPGHGEAICF